MLGAIVTSRDRRGQVMIESVLTMIVILLVFLALFNLSDQLRAKLLVENAAAKCARARAVGYNDFMLRKIARLSTMPASGKCLTAADSGDGVLPLYSRYARIGSYLTSSYEAQADTILDFEYWNNGGMSINATSGQSPVTATVTQRRPDDFNFSVLLGKPPVSGGTINISASATMEAHYPDYLQ